MESIFKTVDRLLKKHSEGNLDDLMVELEENEPTLDERLEQIGYTRNKAIAAARAEIVRHADSAKQFGVVNIDYPYVWAELSKKCEEMTDNKLEVILWLIAGGKLIDHGSLSDDEVISSWLHTTQRVKEYKNFLDDYVKTVNDFLNLRTKLEKSKLLHPERKANTADSERVLKLLCNDGYIEEHKEKTILRDNLELISGIIAELSFLEPIKPLIYFQIYVRYKKKLLNDPNFVPNRKKILGERKYDFTKDNGKNFKQYAIYCALYSELKKCFLKADTALCDAGFLLCSNLADWWLSIGTEYTRNPNMDIPLTIDGLIMERCVTCFEASEVGRTMNVSPEQLIKWQESYDKFCENAQKSIQNIKFSDLPAFVDNSTEFCGKLFDQKQLEGNKHVNHDIAWALFVREVEERFDELLEEELSLMISKWIVAKIGK